MGLTGETVNRNGNTELKKSKIMREKISKTDARKYLVEMLARILDNQRWRK